MLATKVRQNVDTQLPQITKKILFTHRERILSVLLDFDNTLQLGDKEELKARLEHIVDSLRLEISKEDLETTLKLSCWREMKTQLVNHS